MTDTIPDENAAFYVHEIVTLSNSDNLPYQAFYGPFSHDAANEKAAALETDFAERQRVSRDPEGTSVADRTQNLDVITAADFDAIAAGNQEGPTASAPTVPATDVTAGAVSAAPSDAAPAAADPTPPADPATDSAPSATADPTA